MILFPNRSVARPEDVRDGPREETRKHGAEAVPRDEVDQASLDSFPASDAPPWTLASIGPPARSEGPDDAGPDSCR
jgi:hypothetical protein